MSLPVQFSVFVIIIIVLLYLVFYKFFIDIGRAISRHFKKIKNEIKKGDE